MLTPSELLDLLQQTAKTRDKLVTNLNEHSILEIQDFQKLYVAVARRNSISTAYPIVVLRKVGEGVQEDHLVLISNDRT